MDWFDHWLLALEEIKFKGRNLSYGQCWNVHPGTRKQSSKKKIFRSFQYGFDLKVVCMNSTILRFYQMPHDITI